MIVEITNPNITEGVYKVSLLSRWQDSNLRPPAPKAGWVNLIIYQLILLKFQIISKLGNEHN